jgi:hypothetical protein
LTPSLWLARELPDTALTLDCGRWCEFTEEAVGGGMGEGSSWLPLLVLLELENEACVWVLPWAESGLRKGALGAVLLAVPLLLLFLRSAALLVIAGRCEGPPRRSGAPLGPRREAGLYVSGLLGGEEERQQRLRGRKVDDARRQHAGGRPRDCCWRTGGGGWPVFSRSKSGTLADE